LPVKILCREMIFITPHNPKFNPPAVRARNIIKAKRSKIFSLHIFFARKNAPVTGKAQYRRK
jgi:hypothetical protein